MQMPDNKPPEQQPFEQQVDFREFDGIREEDPAEMPNAADPEAQKPEPEPEEEEAEEAAGAESTNKMEQPPVDMEPRQDGSSTPADQVPHDAMSLGEPQERASDSEDNPPPGDPNPGRDRAPQQQEMDPVTMGVSGLAGLAYLGLVTPFRLAKASVSAPVQLSRRGMDAARRARVARMVEAVPRAVERFEAARAALDGSDYSRMAQERHRIASKKNPSTFDNKRLAGLNQMMDSELKDPKTFRGVKAVEDSFKQMEVITQRANRLARASHVSEHDFDRAIRKPFEDVRQKLADSFAGMRGTNGEELSKRMEKLIAGMQRAIHGFFARFAPRGGAAPSMG